MTETIRRRMGAREWTMLVALSVLWGGSFFFVGVAVRALPPVTVVALRVAGAALILAVVLRALGLRLPTGSRLWAAFFGMALLNNAVPFLLITWGQTAIASGLAAILNATTPLFGVVLAHFLTADEKLTPSRLAGVATGFAGVVVMVGPAALDALDKSLAAQLACLGAAFSYALAGIYGRRFKRLGVSPLVTAAGQVTASTMLLVPLALLIEAPWRLAPPGLETWAALAGLASLSTALAYILFFRILAAAGATNILLVTFLVPVSAILLGIAFLGERLAAGHLAGMALIGLGLALIDGRLVGAAARLGARQPAAGGGRPPA
jgi:drug/metabolite transporter (DMT)-like permease